MTVESPVKEQPPDGMSHGGAGPPSPSTLGRGGHGFAPFVKSILSQQSRSNGTRLAVVYTVPLRSIALRVGGLPTGASVSHSCDRKVPMVL